MMRIDVLLRRGAFRWRPAPDEATLAHRADQITGQFGRIESALGRGPWFAGEAFSLVELWVNERRTSWERKLDRLGEFLAAKPDGSKS